MLAEIEISYAGINCEARARLAADIIKKRAARDPMLGNQTIQYDLIGVNSLWPGDTPGDAREVRLRVAARVPHQARRRPADHRGRVALRERPGGRRRRAHREPADDPHLHGLRAAREGHAALAIRRGVNGQIELFYLAHSRTGDKGDSQTMSLIPYRAEDYALIERQVTADAVSSISASSRAGQVTRYELPNLGAFNFVLEETLQGGVNDSLNLDTHGKSRSAVLLAMMVNVPEGHPALRLKAAQS